jgi:hypothetical protein
MKTRQQRKTLKEQSQSLVKRDSKRDLRMRKVIQELKRQSGQEFYFIEGSCFDYCC